MKMNQLSFVVTIVFAVLCTGCSNDLKAQQKMDAKLKPVLVDLPKNIDKSRNRNVPVTFHLPTQQGPQPLVLISHGGAGSRDGLYALATELAKQGYVAMCLEHVTSNLDDVRLRMKNKRLRFKDAVIDCGNDMKARKNRPLDVRFAIDLAQKLNRDDVRLKNRLDLSKIAMLGHSYGAYTTMVCCGVKPVNIEGELSEPRIKLGIALSPQSANGAFFNKDSFSKVTSPFIGISGTEDKTFDINTAEQRKDFFKLMPKGDKHLIWLHDAGHFSFSDPSGSARRSFLRPDRDVTKTLKIIVPAILDSYILGKTKLDNSTRDKLVQKSLGGKVKKIDWLSN